MPPSPDGESGVIDPAHLPAVLEALAQVRRGERATPEQVEAAFALFSSGTVGPNER